jgi:hypothetical protein
LVDVCTELFDQALHYSEVTKLGGEEQWRTTRLIRLMDVGAQLFDHSEITLHGRHL